MASTKNFSSDELKCSCCGDENIQQWALEKLQLVRDSVDRPLTITSAYRCSNHPVEARKATGKVGTHRQGIAFDIYVGNGFERGEIVTAGILHGASGIGVDKNFVHLDWRDTDLVMWVYS